LVGLGNIGFRHLEGLLKSKSFLEVHLVDIDERGLSKAKQLVEKLSHDMQHKIIYRNSIPKGKEYDVAILATNADVRKDLVKDLLKKSNCKFLILEKVAFQNSKDFEEILNLAKLKAVDIRVNCPRRMNPLFNKLKKELKDQTVEITVSGNDWGLGSNFIHMLDLLVFLTGEETFFVDSIKLENKIFESKRPSFFEFKGEIVIKTSKGNYLSVKDSESLEHNFSLQVMTHKGGYLIDNDNRLMKELSTSGKIENQYYYEEPYQSNLSNLLIDQICDEGLCQLTDLEESFKFHQCLFSILNTHLEDLGYKYSDNCPIT